MNYIKIFIAAMFYFTALPFGGVSWVFKKIAEGFVEIGERFDDSLTIRRAKKK